VINLLSSIYDNVARTSTSALGFYHQSISRDVSSHDLRTAMITIGDHLIDRIKSDLGISMDYFSMGRVDQKNTTKIHLDGAPPQSILILGYEPSLVRSTVSVIDYIKYCSDNGVNVSDFLKDYNPMYSDGIDFANYTTRLVNFDNENNNIIVINNSSSDCSSCGMCGLMHLANVRHSSEPRIINTINIADLSSTQNTPLGEIEKQLFVDVMDVNVAYNGK
jgi:hypothetical protein